MLTTRTSPDEPNINPDWEPPIDPVFQYLLQEALFGSLPVFFAAISLPRIKRFAPDFRPENSTDGDKVAGQIMQQWQQGNFARIWVYPKGDLFIMSDDYFTLAAAEKGQPDYVPCWILGTPGAGTTKDIQGPVDQAGLRKMFGDE